MNQQELKAKALELIYEAEKRAEGSPTRARMFEEARVYAILANVPDPVRGGWSTTQPGQAY